MHSHQVVSASGKSLSPAHTAMRTSSSTPPIRELGQNTEPERRALPAATSPGPEDAPLAGGDDASDP